MSGEAPLSTYRLQVRPGFGFEAVGEVAGHLAGLGITHAYLSPILAPVPGSAHGYDVVDHAHLNPDAGGRDAFDAMSARLRAAGLRAVADVVPNHMAVPTPASLNAPLWSVLRDGQDSPYAHWFDVDWSVPGGGLLMPVLGSRLPEVVAAGELIVDVSGEEPLLRYFDHVFPVRPGTADLPLAELADRQWYRLAWWRVADEELNYRRFFDVDTLIAVRVEDEDVFEASHALLGELLAAGDLTGLRIDHPDGLADPRGYLRSLARLTGGAWIVVEKILEGEEELPADWQCAGTTGYDALWRVGGLFVDPAGGGPLLDLLAELTGSDDELEVVVDTAKREVAAGSLVAEVERLTALAVGICRRDLALRDHTRRALRTALVELLVAMDRYRAYVVPGEDVTAEAVAVLDGAAGRAGESLDEVEQAALDAVRSLALGTAPPLPESVDSHVRLEDARLRAEFVVRFQQTCGPVMAKGIEDTAFYRWFRLTSLNEVGGDPAHVGVLPADFHAYCAHRAATWPQTMTTLSTHDTKRSEDVRARISTLSELPEEWAGVVRTWSDMAADHRTGPGLPDPATEYLIWQTLVGTWDGHEPIASDRLLAYLQKATREAKRRTTWTDPDTAYEDSVETFARGVLGDAALMRELQTWCGRLAGPARVGVLGQKLVQLTMPGVPDVYQGTELVDLSLVDPDNRRDVDFADRRSRLAALDDGIAPADLSDEKLLVTSQALRLRRDRPEWFGGEGTYLPLESTSPHLVAFARGDVDGPGAVTVVTRLPVSLEASGGWGDHTVALPPGSWTDLLSGSLFEGGDVEVAGLLSVLPVALLARR